MRKTYAALAGAMALLVAAACSDRNAITEAGRGLAPKGASHTVVTGAAFTTVDTDIQPGDHCQTGNAFVNCNIYDGKEFVWLNGGPASAQVGGAGNYLFAVLSPAGQNSPNDGEADNLSDPTTGGDSYLNRVYTVDANGNITGYTGSHQRDGNKIQLIPYDDTGNPGGVYIMAVCAVGDAILTDGVVTGYAGYPIQNPSACKYDMFKIGSTTPVPIFDVPGISKTAAGAYTNTYKWTITKDVDKTLVQQVGGTATFNYTVKVTHDAGTVSGVTVSGTITVTNLNKDGQNNVAPIDISGVTDQLSDGTNCTVTGGGAQTLSTASKDFAYSCSLSAVPTSELDNTATVSWPDQVLSNGAVVTHGSAPFQVQNISFTATTVDNSVTVTDTFNGTLVTLGTVSVGDDNPKSYTYSHTVNVPASTCVKYDNTATFTTNTSGTTGSANQSVQVCGAATGGLTIGFWNNKNGQGIITGGGTTSSVCNSGTYLRTFAPFQDLSPTANCAAVATYVSNIIKAANASGASMNAMLKAQMLATALDVFFSLPANGNPLKAPLPLGGVKIDLTHICKMIDGSGGTATCSGTYQNVSTAFGGATSLTVTQILLYAASQSNVGGSTWYGQVKATQEMAKNTFDAINNGVALVAP